MHKMVTDMTAAMRALERADDADGSSSWDRYRVAVKAEIALDKYVCELESQVEALRAAVRVARFGRSDV